MGKKYVKVTAEMVRTAHQYEDDPRKFTREEIAAMAGTSLTTLHRILHGEYDYLLAPVEQVHTQSTHTCGNTVCTQPKQLTCRRSHRRQQTEPTLHKLRVGNTTGKHHPCIQNRITHKDK